VAEMFAYAFMQKALLAGLLVGLLCSLVSFFVVLKRLSFIGAGISHSAFGGVALGIWLGINPLLSAAVFSTLIAWAIGLVSRKGHINEDVTIGIFFSSTMALGVAIIGLIKGYVADVYTFLFGNILAVTATDLWWLGGCGLLVGLVLIILHKEFLFLCFDEEMARASGLPTGPLYYILLTAIALTIVVSVKVVGVVLASALLVIPAATGYELSKNYRGMLLISLLTGVVSAIGGLWLSFQYNLASGATIVLVSAVIFFLALLLSPRRCGFWRFRHRHPPAN
jgi:zinc transport system permease protein